METLEILSVSLQFLPWKLIIFHSVWGKSLEGVIHKLPDVSNDRVVAIHVLTTNRPVCFLSVYLPYRSGCTDNFKDCLDYVDAVLGQLSHDSDVYILGDLNADPGSGGGALATTTANE